MQTPRALPQLGSAGRGGGGGVYHGSWEEEQEKLRGTPETGGRGEAWEFWWADMG